MRCWSLSVALAILLVSASTITAQETTGTIKGRPLFVVYVKDATAATTGLPAQPGQGTPWIMHPGTIKAHIMFAPTM